MNNYYLTVCYHEINADGKEAEGVELVYRRTCHCLPEVLNVIQRLPRRWIVCDIMISIR